MNKKIILLLFLLCLTSTYSQEKVSSIAINIPKKSEAFQFQDEENKNVFLFFDNKKEVSSYKLDENLKVVDSIKINKGENKIESIVGYAKNQSTYYTYWNSNNKKLFYVLSYNFEKKESKIAPISFDTAKEYVINKITIQNKFYVITTSKESNCINFYCFNNETFTKKTINLSKNVFYDSDNNSISFYELCTTYSYLKNQDVRFISEDNPASLQFASHQKKSYVNDNSIIFTFDNNKEYTQFLKINLDNYKTEYKLFSQPHFEKNPDQYSYDPQLSNSFFVNNTLIQLRTNLLVLTISVKDMNKNIVKTFNIELDKEIDFKNSEIIQEKLNIKNTRILDKSNQFLRKMGNAYPAISCYFTKDIYHLTLGSISEEQTNNTAMYGGMFGVSGVLLSYALTSNYTVNNVNSYNNRTVVYINCLFDKDFNHIKEEKKQLAFDKLRLFVSNSKLTNNIAFRLNDKLIYGGSNLNKKFDFYSFSDN